jgi:hypothetical protein
MIAHTTRTTCSFNVTCTSIMTHATLYKGNDTIMSSNPGCIELVLRQDCKEDRVSIRVLVDQ